MSILDKLNPTLKMELETGGEPSGVALHLRSPKHLTTTQDRARALVLHGHYEEAVKKGELPSDDNLTELMLITSKINPSVADYIVNAEIDGGIVSEEDLKDVKSLVESDTYGYGGQVKSFLTEKGLLPKDLHGDA